MNKRFRNYGYGKQIEYAARTAILDRYGTTSQGTQAAYRNRIKHLLRYLRAKGIADFRSVGREEMEGFAQAIGKACDEGRLARATATNVISTASVLIGHMSGRAVCASQPSKYVGRRSRVRQLPPLSMDITKVLNATEHLSDEGLGNLAMLVMVCRTFGLRAKEGSLLKLRDAAQQAESVQKIDIRRGTKGGRGRSVQRWVGCDAGARQLLVEAAAHSGPTSCLIQPGLNWVRWYQQCYRRWAPVGPQFGLATGFGDLRAAFACDRYQQITGQPAPVVAGRMLVERDLDLRARTIISEELGHGRNDVAASYVGGRKP